MPAVKFDNRVSWMDIGVALGVVLSGAGLYFSYGEEIRDNTSDIEYIKQDIIRVEIQQESKFKELLDEIKEQRTERREDINNLNNKINKLIDRELDNR